MILKKFEIKAEKLRLTENNIIFISLLNAVESVKILTLDFERTEKSLNQLFVLYSAVSFFCAV